MTSPIALVMTATIVPPKFMTGSVRNDPGQRLREYEDAFRFYLGVDETYIDEIIFFENSGNDLTPFRNIANQYGGGKKVSLISTSQDYPAEKGKAYGEFFMLDHGLASLRELSETKNFGKSQAV